MNKQRLDVSMTNKKLVITRSQAESYIKLGKVKVNGRVVSKAGFLVSEDDRLELTQHEQYVSRAGLKLASIAADIGLDFRDKIVLDVGSSTGGFTDYALRSGAAKVIAVDVGTDQLHSSLLGNPKIELHERTDIRSVQKLSSQPDIVLIDVSFISLREVLPHIMSITSQSARIAAMVKPQFEAGKEQINKGIIKNHAVRRQILKDFENWSKERFVIKAKADSHIAGAKGNQERFYLLQPLLSKDGTWK